MKAEKVVEVTINYCDKDEPGLLGYYTRKKPKLVDSEWQDTDEDEIIFGYCDLHGYMTHMCYSLNMSMQETWEDFAATSRHARKFDVFYFDAGSNGRPLYTTYHEVRRALVELGLLSSDAIKYCKQCKHSKLIHAKRGECTYILEENEAIESNCTCAAFFDDED